MKAFRIALAASTVALCSMADPAPESGAGGGDAAKKDEPKTVADNMAGRRVFPTVEAAAEYLTASATNFSDFAEMTLAAPGVDAEGNFDPAIYTDQMDVMVATLRKAKEGVKAIVVAPVPKLNVVLGMGADEYAAIPDSQRSWIERILHKELNHVAVRNLRDAEDVSTVVDQMPTTLDAYLTSERGTGGIMEAFNELYKQLNATLSAKIPVWAKQRFVKVDLRKALESAGFAREYYPQIEDYKGESLFAAALRLGVSAAKRKGLDPTIFERWAATRDAKEFKPGQTDDDDFDLDDIEGLTDSLLSDDAKPADESATEPTSEDAEAEQPADESEQIEETTDEEQPTS